jgi:hypothetical protein
MRTITSKTMICKGMYVSVLNETHGALLAKSQNFQIAIARRMKISESIIFGVAFWIDSTRMAF